MACLDCMDIIFIKNRSLELELEVLEQSRSLFRLALLLGLFLLPLSLVEMFQLQQDVAGVLECPAHDLSLDLGLMTTLT